MKTIQGQNTIEYLIILTVVAFVITSMRMYIVRNIQGVAREAAEQIGPADEYGNQGARTTNATVATSTTTSSAETTRTQVKTLSNQQSLTDFDSASTIHIDAYDPRTE